MFEKSCISSDVAAHHPCESEVTGRSGRTRRAGNTTREAGTMNATSIIRTVITRAGKSPLTLAALVLAAVSPGCPTPASTAKAGSAAPALDPTPEVASFKGDGRTCRAQGICALGPGGLDVLKGSFHLDAGLVLVRATHAGDTTFHVSLQMIKAGVDPT